MKKITLVAALVGVSYFSNAQVGIGTSTPAESAQLEIKAGDKGVLIPRVTLTDTEDVATVTGTEVESLLVYNTAISATTVAEGKKVAPGFYYWVKDSATTPRWERIVNQTQLDEAIANISNMQADLDKVLALLKVAFPSNNLVNPSVDGATHGGGMVFTPGKPANGTDPAVAPKIEYVYFDGANYIKKDITADITDLIKGAESKTTFLEYPAASGKFYYISEETIQANGGTVPTSPFSAGTTLRPGVVYLDVPASVIKNFKTILDGTTTIVKPGTTNEYFTVEEYIQYISETSDANVGYTVTAIAAADNGGVAIPANSLYYINQAGNKVVIDFGSIVKANETKTFFKKITNATNGNTQYLYFSEEAIQTWLAADSANTVGNIPDSAAAITIDAVGDVVNNFESVLEQTTVYNTETVTIKEIIQEIASEVDGNVIYKNISTTATPEFVFQYWDTSVTPAVYKTINLGDIVKTNETKTKIVTIENKQFYLAENFVGSIPTTIPSALPTGMYPIDVVGGVINNIEEIFTTPTTIVINEGTTNEQTFTSVEQYIEYISNQSIQDGVTKIVLDTAVTPAQAKFQMWNNTTKQWVDVNSTAFSTIVKANETNTTLVKSDTTNLADPIVYTYSNEDFLKSISGATQTQIAITADMVTSITNNTDVQNAISKFLNQGGNVYFTRTAIAAGTPTGQLAIPANSFYEVDASGIKVLIDLAQLVKDLETKTQIKRSEVAVDGTLPAFGDTRTAPVAANVKKGEIFYEYNSEVSTNKDFINVTADMISSITNNEEVKNAIKNVLNQGGNVYFTKTAIVADAGTGQIAIPANTLYTIERNAADTADVKVPIDISGTVMNVITNNAGDIKNILGDNFNNTTIVNTGDTWIDGNKIYRGIFESAVTAKTANVLPITLVGTVGNVIDIKILNKSTNQLINTTTTDVKVTAGVLSFKIGTGNMYVVLPEAADTTTNFDIKVIVEYSANITTP